MTDTSETPGPIAEAEPPLDRTISPIAGRMRTGAAGKAMVFAGLVAGCGVFLFAGWRHDQPPAERAPEQPARQVVAYEPAPPTLQHPGPDAPQLIRAGDIPADPRVPALDPSARVGGPTAAASAATRDTARTSPILAYSRSGGAGPVLPYLTPGPTPAGVPTELDALRRGSTLGRSRPDRLGDRNFLLLAGTTIPCVLQTAMDSTAPGFVTGLIPTDVYSDNGAVVLLEKGTRVIGEYRANLRQGQGRLFVLWTRAVTPAGVAIDLASPASDGLGRAGVGGVIDTHFWDRFGAGLLLSVVDAGTSALADDEGQDGLTRLPSDAAGVAVGAGVNIPPTLRKAQGAEVSILAARDFDFSSVYGLRNR